MSIDDIISAVRYCIDEQAIDDASFGAASANDNTYMDNIIKNKIGDALRWVCLYAPAELLGGTDEPDTMDTSDPPVTTPHPTGVLVDVAPIPTAAYGGKAGVVDLAGDFIKLARVRVEGWHRAIKVSLIEDSDEYLQLLDSNGATATADRPQAAIIDKASRKLELWPWTSEQDVELTYVASVDPEANAFLISTVKHYPLPPKTKTSFIYYLAFLLLSAYNDARAERMLSIAKMNLGGVQ